MDAFTVRAKVEISMKRIADVLATAFEGGSNYWAEISDYKKPREIYPWDTENVYPHIQYPLSLGGAVMVTVTSENMPETYQLNLVAIKKGLAIMAEKYPLHFAEIVSGDYDADDGDIFLQCCLLGDAIYG